MIFHDLTVNANPCLHHSHRGPVTAALASHRGPSQEARGGPHPEDPAADPGELRWPPMGQSHGKIQ